uniref:PVR related immunoglobulin domain containing n=1 Tax=Macaca mulatta TaxID=9544 RepID=A0A1D5RAV9_MACMU|nr:transmembrane protein PVRIG isoform X1 [Macaca mulatta]
MRTEAQVLALQSPEPGLEGAMGRRTLALPWVLLTLCVTAGTPEVWVQVQMEATELSSFTVHCGFLGPGSISLVTVSWGGPDGAGGTKLAVLHPELGTRQWAPARQARWETQSSISLALEDSGASSPFANTTFCCKFASFPEGSWESCGSLPPSSDPGLSAPPTPVPILRADLAGILGLSGVLLFGCGYLLHLLRRQKHRRPARPPRLLSTTLMPLSTPASAQLLWTRLTPTGGHRSPPTPHTSPRALPPRPPHPSLHVAALSLLRTDSTLRQGRGLPTPVLASLFSLTVGVPGPWKDALEFDERDHEATGLSPSLASWAPPPYFILGPPISVPRVLGQAHLLRMWSVCVHAWGCVGTGVSVCVTEPHSSRFLP